MIAPNSIHAVTVPGAIDAWAAILAAHGRFGLDRVLAPAIHYAESGFPVAARIAWDWAQAVGKLRADAGAARHLLFDGRAPAEGDVVRLPALAQTLKTIAAQGPRAFYEGELARGHGRRRWPREAPSSLPRTSPAIAARWSRRSPTNYRGLDVLRTAAQHPGPRRRSCCSTSSSASISPHSIRSAPTASISRSRRRVLPMPCAIRTSPIPPPCGFRSPDLLDKTFAAKLAAPHRPRKARAVAARAVAGQRHRLSHGRRPRPHGGVADQYALFRLSASASAPRRPASCSPTAAPCFVVDPDHPNTFGPAQAADAHHHPGARLARRAAASCRSA